MNKWSQCKHIRRQQVARIKLSSGDLIRANQARVRTVADSLVPVNFFVLRTLFADREANEALLRIEQQGKYRDRVHCTRQFPYACML